MPKQVDWDQIQRNFNKMKRDLPKALARDMVNHTKKAFRDEGFTDSRLSPWKPRKTTNRADRNNPRRRRAILVDSGALRRSPRKKKANFSSIRVGVYGIPYASRHNRGLDGMPQRQFIGQSRVLDKKLQKTTRRHLRNIFKT